MRIVNNEFNLEFFNGPITGLTKLVCPSKLHEKKKKNYELTLVLNSTTTARVCSKSVTEVQKRSCALMPDFQVLTC